MNYGTAEQEIVDRLNSQIAANNASDLYEAVLMPDTNADYNAFVQKFTKSRVAVQFVDSKPGGTNSTNKVSQDEVVTFRLTFEAKKLRGAGQLYALMEVVKLCLIGFQLSNAISRLTFVKYGLLDFEQAQWQPYFEFECKFVNVQSFTDFSDDEIIGGPMTDIKFSDDLV